MSALITGCYPGRTKVFGTHGPNERGLEPACPTMGEVFKSAGYKTALFGKWYCGDQPDTHVHMNALAELEKSVKKSRAIQNKTKLSDFNKKLVRATKFNPKDN